MKKRISILLILMAAVISITSCVADPPDVNADNVWSVVDTYTNNISVSTKALIKGEVPEGSGTGNGSSSSDIAYEMPDISNYPLLVKGNGEVDVEIFIPNENNGSTLSDFIKIVAEKFNASGKTSNGKTLSVSVRSLEASLAEDYIHSGIYTPDGYIAPNELYGTLMAANGIEVSLIADKLIGNTMGIAIQKAKYEELKSTYSDVTIKTIVDATKDGKLAVGYTNPTNNPTGLNFVISMLAYFDADNPMSFEATTDFSAFQSAVPLVSYSMEQMKDAVKQNKINAFVVERQAFSGDTELSGGYVYMPFGVRHDNPLYSIGETSEDEKAALEEFANLIKTSEMQAEGANKGFNQDNDYISTVNKYEVGVIKEVINVWKNARANSGEVSVVFVADISGSMSGDKIKNLKTSLINSMPYISEDTRVGLISYSSYVYVDLPIGKFDKTQQEYFAGATEGLYANGGTATNNALLVAAKMLNAEPVGNRKLIIVLSDGHTGSGYSSSITNPILDCTEIPIYTIGYGKNADENELTEIAKLNNGLYNLADLDNIGYLMKTIFNAEA